MAAAILGTLEKQPTEVKIWNFDYAEWLDDKDDTISGTPTVTATVLQGSGSLTISGITHTSGIVQYTCAGGVDGSTYKVTCTVVTTDGRTEVAEAKVKVKDA